MVEDVPRGAADEVARHPQCTAMWTSLGHLIGCGKRERLCIGLLNRRDHDSNVRHCLVWLPPINHSQIAIVALDNVIDYPLDVTPAATPPLSQLFTASRLDRFRESLPARVYDRLHTPHRCS